MSCAVSCIYVQVWADCLCLCAAVNELYCEIPPVFIQMVTFTITSVQIIYTRAPKLGRHNPYRFLASRSQRSVLDLLAISPGKLVQRALVVSTKGVSMALTHRAMIWARGVLLVLNACADGGWCCCEVCGFSDFLLWLATHFQDVQPLALLCSALLCCLLMQPFSQVNTCKRERELLISHEYFFFISAEGKKVIYISSCLWQIIKH